MNNELNGTYKIKCEGNAPIPLSNRDQYRTSRLIKITEAIRGEEGVCIDPVDMMVKVTSQLLGEIYDMAQDKPLKIHRTEDAKQFPLIAIKKAGDIGYDLPAVFPYKNEYKDIENRERLLALLSKDPIGNADFLKDPETNMRHSMTIMPGERKLVPTGISLEIPEGYWVLLTARSSTSKSLLIVPNGIIDQGYRGELFAQVINIGDHPQVIRHGDRLVQIIKFRNHNRLENDIIEVDELSPSERGATGFGSTGKTETITSPFNPVVSLYGQEDPNNIDYID